jgi:hypothetical protein
VRWLPVLLAVPLLAQQQPTFYSAWQDGLNAEKAGHWAEAAAAFRRALELRPAPSPRIVIYGNNLLFHYYPRTRLARCLVELGDLDGAEAELQKAGREPAGEREALTRRIQGLRPKNNLRPAPIQPERETAPSPPRPSPAPPAATLTVELPSSPDKGIPPPDNGVPRVEPALANMQEPANLAKAPREPLPKAGSAAPPEGPLNTPPPPAQRPTAETPRPLPWMPLGLGAGLALVAAWAWTRRSARKVRFDRRGAGAPSFSPGALPKTVGPYRIERLLGRGGFSDTFLAQHGTTGQEVALKVPHLHRADDAEFRARFHQEAQLGARLIHPNLVRILDPGQVTGRPYLAMEYLPGPTLDERLGKQGSLPLDEFLTIATGAAKAMAHAHAHGVVHRDLKPGNILLTAQGPKVMDLGIARIMDAATVTSTYAFLGTPLYAAPEAQLKTHVGPAADRYSLGVILFHMLTGAPPFLGETPFEILDRHRSALPPDLTLQRPDVPPALNRLVSRLLDKEPDQRPEDSEILRVLAEVAASLNAPPSATLRD